MSKVLKKTDSIKFQLDTLMNSLDEAGCLPGEKIKAQKIFQIYFDGKAKINMK